MRMSGGNWGMGGGEAAQLRNRPLVGKGSRTSGPQVTLELGMKPLLLALLCWMPLAAADAARDNAWRQDLDTLATQLPLRHPNLFFQTPRAVFDKAVADLRAAIPDLPDTDVMVGLARIAALPGDGHTNLWLFQSAAAPAFRLLPLQLKWFADGLFCTGSSAEYAKARGARVTRIGGRAVDEAYAAVAPIISHENDIWVREMSPIYLANADVLRALGVAPRSGPVRFEFRSLAGETFTLDVGPGGPGEPLAITPYPDPASGFTPLYQQHRDRNYWFAYIESSRTLYFAYNQCAEMPGFPFAEFNDLLWATFDTKPVERVI